MHSRLRFVVVAAVVCLLLILLQSTTFFPTVLRRKALDIAGAPFRFFFPKHPPVALCLPDNNLEELRSENKRLRALLAFKERLSGSPVAAAVIGRDAQEWSGAILIDRGTSDGVGRNDIVLSERGLMGRITDAGGRTARVMLVTDPNSRVACLVGRSREEGLLIGLGNGLCKVIYLSFDSDVALEDIIVTSGGGVFIKGITIGEVIKVGKDRARLYTYAIVRPYAHIKRTEEVICIKP